MKIITRITGITILVVLLLLLLGYKEQAKDILGIGFSIIKWIIGIFGVCLLVFYIYATVTKNK